MYSSFRRGALVAAVTLLTAACAPAPRSAPAASPAAGEAPAAQAVRSSPKRLVAAAPFARVGGVKQAKPIVHNLLTAENDGDVWIPELAAEQLSFERGSWQLNPDGSMTAHLPPSPSPAGGE